MGLHIGIDGSCMTAQKAGIGFYVARLLQALDKLPGEERYTIFSNKQIPELGLSNRFQAVITPFRSSTIWAQTILRFQLHKHPVDLYHSGSVGIPLWYRGNTVITVHDLSYLQSPSQKDWATRILWGWIGPKLIRQSTHILADSESTKEDVIHRLGISDSKITTVYLAADPLFRPIEDKESIQRFRKKHGLERDFILFVGTLEPRKNLPFLMRCFAKCIREGRIDGDLVIVGKKGWLCDKIFETERELGLGDRLKFIGYVDDAEDLRRYYCGCRFFALPSLMEGFGLPPLEAMGCGVPVIASDRGSLPEVVGDAGLLLDPEDSQAWEDALARWWNAPGLSEWKEKGLRQAAKFSWQQTAEQTLEVYRRVTEPAKM
ncbi:MAG: glycosyltransferase family 1 protein [bacterium]